MQLFTRNVKLSQIELIPDKTLMDLDRCKFKYFLSIVAALQQFYVISEYFLRSSRREAGGNVGRARPAGQVRLLLRTARLAA